MRTIDADRLIKVIEKAQFEGSGNIMSIINDAPTVDAIPNREGYEMYNKGYMSGYERGKEERPQGECDCSDCDYFKFSQSFIENVVKFMTDYNIETVEGLMKELNHINELLGGKQ